MNRNEIKSPYEADVHNIDVVLIVLGGLVAAMLILAMAAVIHA